MCGIAGVLTADGGGRDLRPAVAGMQASLAHRGPDAHGEWVSPGAHAAFAHQRLAVLDLSPGAGQPMTADGLTIVLNGEIYNFLELRSELERRGARFQTRSDTEVVLRAYQAYGDACVERLRGMFAFALWDEPRRRCLLARDRFGIKPLYLAERGGRLVFASEVRAILAGGLVPVTIDPQALYGYFRAGSVPEPRTLVASVRVLEAGTVTTWSGGIARSHAYSKDVSFRNDLSGTAAIVETRDALRDSLEHHLLSDVPAGIFLSGGVDSTALLILAARTGHRLRALTMSLPGHHEDELVLAERTAKRAGVEHDVCRIDAHTARQLLPTYLEAMDQPTIDGLNTLVVSRLAREAGLKVVLSGVGADELFGGYPSFQAVPRFALLRRFVPASAGPGLSRVAERLPNSRWRRAADLFGDAPGIAGAYAMFRGIFTGAEARRLTREFTGSEPGIDRGDVQAEARIAPQDAVCNLEMTRYLRNQLLRDADVMGMANGVEVRLPFLDSAVVDTVTRVPWRERFDRSKSLLLNAVPEVPTWVARQPKRGFMFPMEDWSRGEWADAFASIDATSPVPAGTWYRKWCLLAFDEWRRRVTARTPSPAKEAFRV